MLGVMADLLASAPAAADGRRVRTGWFIAITLLIGQTSCDDPFFKGPRVLKGLDFVVTRDLEADNARYRLAANQRVNQLFAPGSSAAAMKAELLTEGFRPYEKLSHPLVAPDPKLAHEIVNAETRLADFNFRHRTLHYGWTTPRAPLPFCARAMNVWWTEDGGGRLLTVGGAVWDDCSK
jgi:hypothetical protein